MKLLRRRFGTIFLALTATFTLLLMSPNGYAEEQVGVSHSSHESTTATPDGSSVTRSADRVWDPESKTWKRAISTTDEEGNTVVRYTETEKTDDGYTRNSTVVGPDGKTAQRSGRGTWDPETKTWKRDVIQEGPEGESAYKGVEAKKSEEGYTRNSAMSDSKGSTATRSATGERDSKTKTWRKSVRGSGPKGKTFNRQSEYSGEDEN